MHFVRLVSLAAVLALVAAACSTEFEAEVTLPADPTSTSSTATTATSVNTATTATVEIPATASGCSALLVAFADQPAANAGCDEDWLVFDGTGLAESDPPQSELRMMVGITGWILRVPLAYDYEWRIPTDPQWLDEIVEASPRGPTTMGSPSELVELSRRIFVPL